MPVLLPQSGEALAIVLFLAFPLSFAYAILRHRLFDIRVIIRQGLQYAFARGLLLSVVPALAALLLADLLLHREEPLIAILRGRGWIYAGLGALALAAYIHRQSWLEALDRRFFRERYGAQRLLRDVVEEVRWSTTLEQVAPRMVARIEAALHPEFVAVLVRDPAMTGYSMVAVAPSGHDVVSLTSDSKLLALVRLLNKPLEASWLIPHLPADESELLRQAQIDLLVPIATAPERREAVIALGSKRSEEPYSREDEELLVAIATSVALLLERPAAPTELGRAFEECPECGRCYEMGLLRCTQDGATLVSVQLPRLLNGRYRLDERLGRGGMGTVYDAMDTALDRRVAVKVIRDDLTESAGDAP